MNKNTLLLSSLLLCPAVFAQSSDVVTLDLTKATTELTFNETSGEWNGTFDDDEEVIESQCFLFLHNSMGSYKTWWGFTASNSSDNSYKSNPITYQYSAMAAGGIVLNSDGTVKKDSYGAPEVSKDVPYIVSYASSSFARHPAQILFNDGKNYKPEGVYVNLNSYAYYSILLGDGFARAFTEGDKFTLVIHGVKDDESETTVEVPLASYTNGDLTAARGWKYVDLTSLGEVNEIYFSMNSTDKGTYGVNTPTYFCLDKLSVRPADNGGISQISGDGCEIRYDRESKTVHVAGSDFTGVYNSLGQCVRRSEQSSFSIEDLPAGVYIVKSRGSHLKITK